jgi:glutamate synthase domain-containing protein 3
VFESKFKDLTGQRFGRLFVKGLALVHNGNAKFLCKCDCGTEKIIFANKQYKNLPTIRI